MSSIGKTRGSLHCVAAVLLLAIPACDSVTSVHPLSAPATSKVDSRLFGVWTGQDESGEVAFLVIGKADVGRFEHDVEEFAGKKPEASDVPRGLMSVMMVGLSKDHTLGHDGVFYFFPSTIGTSSYVNLLDVHRGRKRRSARAADDAQGSAGGAPNAPIREALWYRYSLLNYETEGTELRLWGANVDAAADAVQKKLLAGTIKYRDPKAGTKDKDGVTRVSPKDISITDSSENLVKFLREGGDKLLFPRDGKHIVWRRMQ